jgi:preprotein translocase subunit YajC
LARLTVKGLPMLSSLVVFAQDKGPAGGGFDANYFPLLMLGLMALFFFLVIIPGQRRKQREQQEMGTKAEKGDKVLTIAGIYGTIVSISDKEDEIVVQVADNTRMKMTKTSIHVNYSLAERRKGEADKAKQGK